MSSREMEVPTGWFRRALRRIDWKINPVLLRDLRLYARGRAPLASYFIMLTVLVMSGIAYAVAARWEGGDGRALLTVPAFLLAVVCGALIPNMVGERFRGELSSRATELALASALSPERLVRGKLLGAWTLCLLAVSLAMPVLATAYLLGGVGSWSVPGLAAGILYAGAVMPLAQLYLATAGRRTGVMRVVDAAVFIGNVVAMLLYAPLLLQLVDSSDPEYRVLLFCLIAASLLIGWFLYKVTVSRLRSETEEREAPPRRTLALASLIGWILAVAVAVVCRRWGVAFPRISTAETAALASLCVAFPFAWGVYILSHGNAERPRLASSSGWRLRRWLGKAGPDSLTAFFWFGTLLLLAAGFTLAFTTFEGEKYLSLFLAPINAVAFGLAAYQCVVKRVQKDVPGFNRLSSVIFVVNLVLAIPGYFLVNLLNLVTRDSYGGLSGLLPVGLLFEGGGFRSFERALTGLATLAVLLLLLTPSVWRAWRDAGRKERAHDES